MSAWGAATVEDEGVEWNRIVVAPNEQWGASLKIG